MGKFDLNTDELKKFDLSPEENAPKSKYPGPKMVTDEEAGVNSGPTRKLGVLEPGFPGTTEDAIGKAMREYVDQRHMDSLKSFGKEVGGQVAGGALSAGVAAGLKPSTVSTGINSISNFAKTGSSGTFLGAFLKYVGNKAFGEEAAAIAAKGIGKVLPKAGEAGKAAAVAAPNVAGMAAGNVMAQPSTDEPKPLRGESRGVMSNAIDRLRTAAVTDARARELLSRIDAPPPETSGEVTQSTLGSQ